MIKINTTMDLSGSVIQYELLIESTCSDDQSGTELRCSLCVLTQTAGFGSSNALRGMGRGIANNG